MSKYYSKLHLISLYLVLLIYISTGIYAATKTSTSNESLAKMDLDQIPTPGFITSEPDPFEDLTIPYLRSRTYTSNLSELSLYSNNGSYSSYLTSYDSDGLKINGLITIPNSNENPDTDKHPAIIFIHGYIPPAQYVTTEKYAAYVDYLARNGFVVFKIDLRGYGNSEGEASGAYYSSDYIVDTLNAYAALQSSDFVDPAKIGLWGHSMAGNVVFRTVAVKQNIPAVSIWGGAVYTYVDFGDYGISDNSYQRPSVDSNRTRKRRLLFETHGDFDENSVFWSKIVPTNYLDDVTTAVQLNHAVDDNVVSIEYSRNLVEVLKEYPAIVHEINEFSTGGHNIQDPSFTPAMEKTVEFYRTHFQ